MSVGTGTVGSGTQIKYVSWAAGDTIKDVFDGIASVMTGSGGWTLASGTSGSFYTTYYASATTDVRRVYSSPLLAQGSGLSTKYVMLRITLGPTITVGVAQQFYKVQLIPFQSWNSGTDVGTNQAGIPIINNSAGTYGGCADFMYTGNANIKYNAPHTLISVANPGIMYVGYGSTAAYLVMWPYQSVGGALFNGCRVQTLVYGEVAEDVASYTNCPPVYVTTLQRLSASSGFGPIYGTGGRTDTSTSYQGANNTNIGAFPPNHYNRYADAAQPSYYSTYTNYNYSPGSMWLSPCAPGSTTGYTGISNTIRTGPQASAFQRMTMGHLGDFGYSGGTSYFNASSGVNQMFGSGQSLVNGQYQDYVQHVGAGSNAKYVFGYDNPTYTISNTYISAGITALNSTNFKGIEPIFGGGCVSVYQTSLVAAFSTAYAQNPFPMLWQWGRIRGLKFVGASPNPQTTWSTLDTVTMNVDADGFYTKTGGSSATFALVGFAPFSDASTVSYDPTMFWAIPA